MTNEMMDKEISLLRRLIRKQMKQVRENKEKLSELIFDRWIFIDERYDR